MLVPNDVSGIFFLDKPLNLSSNAALQKVKRAFNAQKAGHTGSLDPLATGLLPICLGEATKFSQYLLDAEKEYVVTARLGTKTSTGDAEGHVISTRPVSVISTQLWLQVLERFRGEIFQTPPMYSALKFQGQPLYRFARQGKVVEVATRKIHINELELLEQKENEVTLRVRCSKGTYIRTLVEDIGETLNCGAYVTALRRIALDEFGIGMSTPLEKLQRFVAEGANLSVLLYPPDYAMRHWPSIELTHSQAEALGKGQTLPVQTENRGLIRLMRKGKFIGLGEQSEEQLKTKRLLSNQKFKLACTE